VAASDVTDLLARIAEGDGEARASLLERMYEHLRRIARSQMARERAGHTLSATALVHEAFLDLVREDGASFNDRAHFLAASSLAMRRILVDHARKRSADKRGGGVQRITLDDDQPGGESLAMEDVIALDDALTRLGELDERQASVVVYRAFGAMTDAEIAQILSVSVPTVRRDYRLATAWLRRELGS
jgi:RNA polymerase sigma factor (TIGR02999 family)